MKNSQWYARLTVAVGIILALAIGIITNIAATIIPDAIKPYLGYSWPILLVLAILYLFVQLKTGSKESGSTGQAEAEFQAIWPKLSDSLHQDIQASLASVLEANQVLKTNYPVNLVTLPNIKLYGTQVQTVERKDEVFGKILKEYIENAILLRKLKNEYNQRVYKGEKDSDEFMKTKRKMYEASRKLETTIDRLLQPQVERYDDLILKGK